MITPLSVIGGISKSLWSVSPDISSSIPSIFCGYYHPTFISITQDQFIIAGDAYTFV